MQTIRKFTALVSLLVFMVYVYLFATGSKLPLEMVRGYLQWLKEAPALIVVPLFLILGAGSSLIMAFGIFPQITGVDRARAIRVFWWVFAFVFCLQMVGWVLNR